MKLKELIEKIENINLHIVETPILDTEYKNLIMIQVMENHNNNILSELVIENEDVDMDFIVHLLDCLGFPHLNILRLEIS
jgi:hypothetical protein